MKLAQHFHGMHVTSWGCELTLATPGRPLAVYVGAAVFNPACMTAVFLAVMFGVAGLGVLGAVLAPTLIIAACTGATRSRAVRRALDRRIEQRANERREAARVRVLGLAGPSRLSQYVQLRDLVAEIERTAPDDAHRFELQELLERFVSLAVSHQRAAAALELASARLALEPRPTIPTHESRAAAIAGRRAIHRDACRLLVAQLDDDLEAIEQLVRLVAQRAACPLADDGIEREIERRLWEMEQTDSALEQLSA